jgi:hypothetical protein
MLHVGAPKSGTTFLQRGLWQQRARLLQAGLACPGESGRDMFLGAIEVRESFDTWGFSQERLAGTWERLCGEARAFEGTSVMSHELLAAATEQQVERALATLTDVDLHLVLTVRDPARQVMSEWQERVKNGGAQTFERFQRGVVRQLRDGTFGGSFWRYHDVPAVLERWGAGLPADNVHVVVAPPPGADPLELWRRFAEAVGFDGEAIVPEDEGGANQSLGVAQIALLRRVNDALDGRIPQPGYAKVVKRQFSQSILAGQRSARPTCPAELVDELSAAAQAWCREIVQRGYVVHGDLDDLVPRQSGADGEGPDAVDPEEELTAAAAAISELLVARAQRHAPPPPTVATTRRSAARRAVDPVRRLAGRASRGWRRSAQP